jgi:hypothetical protein
MLYETGLGKTLQGIILGQRPINSLPQTCFRYSGLDFLGIGAVLPHILESRLLLEIRQNIQATSEKSKKITQCFNNTLNRLIYLLALIIRFILILHN